MRRDSSCNPLFNQDDRVVRTSIGSFPLSNRYYRSHGHLKDIKDKVSTFRQSLWILLIFYVVCYTFFDI